MMGRMAALHVVEEDKDVITEEILIEQINIIKYGHKIEKQMVKNLEEELEMTAYHEAAIGNLGMDKELGFINIDSIAVLDNYFLSRQIEKRFLHWLNVAKEHTLKLVDKHWSIIDTLALKLIEQEIVESDELSRIIDGKKISPKIPDSL